MFADQPQTQPPIVVVAGPTGVGKSQLAIELAKRFDGEIVNADAMQLFAGLDIVTNKVTPEELSQAPHHLIGCLPPLTADSTVTAYRQLAQPLLKRLLSEGQMPIICGGTCYYIESLLWDILLPDGGPSEGGGDCESASESGDCDLSGPDADLRLPDNPTPAEAADLHSRLRAVDPEAANRLHPNNWRKVSRALQVNARCGDGAYSAMLRRQSQLGDNFSGPLLYPAHRLAILWLACRRDLLNDRLDKRVDKMMESGLVAELESFHADYNATRDRPDYTRGIFQSIGFKEFHNYLVMPPDQRVQPPGRAALEAGVELMKLRTRRYAERQTKWLRNRFLKHSERNYAPVYRLNADSLIEADWIRCVRNPAFDIVDALVKRLDDSTLLRHPARLQTVLRARPLSDLAVELKCKQCDLVFNTDEQYRCHMTGRRHAKRVAGLKRKAAREKEEAELRRRDALVVVEESACLGSLRSDPAPP